MNKREISPIPPTDCPLSELSIARTLHSGTYKRARGRRTRQIASEPLLYNTIDLIESADTHFVSYSSAVRAAASLSLSASASAPLSSVAAHLSHLFYFDSRLREYVHPSPDTSHLRYMLTAHPKLRCEFTVDSSDLISRKESL